MWLQQKLNPQPTDPTQAAIFAWLPWVFMFMLGGFASGLLIYWIANNSITFAQQYIIMKRHGYTPDLFGNIRSSFRRKKTLTPSELDAVADLAPSDQGHRGGAAGSRGPQDRPPPAHGPRLGRSGGGRRSGEGWRPCRNFVRGAKGPSLMAITARVDGDTIHLAHPDQPN
jgi:hypothetical protein